MHAKERVLDEYTKDDWFRLVFCIDALKEDVIAQWKVCPHRSTCRAKFMFRLGGSSVVSLYSCQDVPNDYSVNHGSLFSTSVITLSAFCCVPIGCTDFSLYSAITKTYSMSSGCIYLPPTLTTRAPLSELLSPLNLGNGRFACIRPSAYQCALAVVGYAIAEKPSNTWNFLRQIFKFLSQCFFLVLTCSRMGLPSPIKSLSVYLLIRTDL